MLRSITPLTRPVPTPVQTLILTLVLTGAGLMAACSAPTNHLERIRADGELVVVTYPGPTTYEQGPMGTRGLEYELAKRFARRLDVELRLVVVEQLRDVLPTLRAGKADLAAAGLTVTQSRSRRVRFAPPYQRVTEQVIHRRDTPRARDVDDLVDGHIEIVAGSSHGTHLRALQKRHPSLEWRAAPRLGLRDLLHLVEQGAVDYVVADSNEFARLRHHFPDLRIGFDLADGQPLAWAFRRSRDDSLYGAAVGFFEEITRDGTLSRLIARNYDHLRQPDPYAMRTFRRHIRERLPRYRPAFERAARRTGLDWRLLAALGYQESHWDPRAVSPTGVRGIMMLTQTTAKTMGIKDRIDPTHSIRGGARYLRRIKDRLPDDLAEPDRTWFALAAYNVGRAHLEDARILTERGGHDPHKWTMVKQYLPRLAERRWYRTTKHGYARGHEPVRYVDNIRTYYDVLVHYTRREHRGRPPLSVLAINAPML